MHHTEGVRTRDDLVVAVVLGRGLVICGRRLVGLLGLVALLVGLTVGVLALVLDIGNVAEVLVHHSVYM